ncbi:oligosaccharide flippase family protein [Aeromicrobium stalagmiti]|uniref:oligosaccharide flippase family protein n=1 Tax=Aeromicrobium stalagmiti TaxID=2738988 RepID=UPI00156853FC|nr:oligosaccharide flippase family protein [Aeromicrobium stalagmiti]NRQ49130.1 oligosaccharide flippase family protein [Aeromicrobium stalagmiti]
MASLTNGRFSSRALGKDGRAALLLGAASLLGPIGGFAANIVYARTLGPSGRGELAAVVAALAVCEAVLVFGFPDVLTRHVSRKTISASALRRVLIIGVAGSMVPAAIVWWWAIDRSFEPLSAATAAAVVPIATIAALGRGVLAGRRAFRRLIGVVLAGGVVRLIAPGILLLANRDDPNLALILIAGSTAVASIPVLLARPFKAPITSQPEEFRRIGHEALTLWPANLAWSLNSRLDQLVLATLIAPDQLGIYAVCVTLAELPVVLASGLRQIIIVRVSERGGAAGVIKATNTILIAGILISSASLMVGGPLMGWVFGSAFDSAAQVLASLILASAFIIAAGLVNSTLIARGLGRLTVVSQGSGLIMSVALLLVVVPLGGGILGAALVNVVTYACVYTVARVIANRSTLSIVTGGS